MTDDQGVDFRGPSGCAEPTVVVGRYLDRLVRERRVVTYQTAAAEIGIPSPHTIHKLAMVLETTIAEDAESGRPLRAAMIVSRARQGEHGPIPAPGFFDAASKAGLAIEPNPAGFHKSQITKLLG
jgi:hypothetical protein